MKRTEPKILHENSYERTIEMTDPDGNPISVKTFYFHCDHGFVCWQQRFADPAAQARCPFPGCNKLMIPGKAPVREGCPIKGHH